MATIFPTGLTYSRNGKDPLVDKVIWSSLADAQAYVDNVNETAYVGMTLSVIGDGVLANNGFWYVESIGTGKDDAYKPGSLKKIGSSEAINAVDYSDALVKAQTLPVGTIIKVLDAEGSVESSDFHAAGFYIVSVSGENAVILYLSTTTGEDMDLEQVITQLTTLTAEVNKKADAEALNNYYTSSQADAKFMTDVTVDGTSVVSGGIATIDLSGKVNVSDYNTYKQGVQDALDAKLATDTFNTTIADYAKTADVVALSDYNTKMGELDAAIALKASQDSVDALTSKVGDAATDSAAATGIYKVIADVEAALKSDITAIPKFAIVVVDALPETGDAATVYLVKEKENAGDLYTEYIFVNGAWENLGKQTVDFSAYSTTAEMNTAIADSLSEAKGYSDQMLAAAKTYAEGLTNIYDAAGSAAAAETAAKAYADGLASNYDAVGSASAAETAAKAYADGIKSELNDAIALKADSQTLTDYIASNNEALGTKADASALDAYTKTEDLDTKIAELGYAKSSVLDAYVTSESLSTTLASYATTQDLNDGLSTKLDTTTFNSTISDYVLKTAVNDSSSVAFVDGIIEVNAITNDDLVQLGIVKA